MSGELNDLCQRVYNATYAIRADNLPIDRFKVRVHPSKRAQALREMPTFVAVSNDGQETVFGLPVVEDPALDVDKIVLFYEVEA